MAPTLEGGEGGGRAAGADRAHACKCHLISPTPQTVHDTLRPKNHAHAAPDPHVPELSRPKCAFKEALRQASTETCGRKRKHKHTNAKYMNWHAPHLWYQVDQVFRNTGPQRSPKDIVAILQK
jgi:hypothetical protein